MKNNRLPRLLRWTSLTVLLAGIVFWAATGARLGWTQTSVVSVQHDEITGIDYPVRRAAFVPGVEFPLVTTVLAGALAGLGWLAGRRTRARA